MPARGSGRALVCGAGGLRRQGGRPRVSPVARTAPAGARRARCAGPRGGDTCMTVSRRLVVWPHHPDMLQRPAANGAELPVTQALTWNVFRTLELMPPAFWLRRLNAALGLAPPAPAP